MANHEATDKWWIGQHTQTSENTYDRGAYSEIEIADVGVDHTANGNFFAGRVLAVGTNGHQLEAGWVEAEFWGDTDQHIYSQDSHSCSGGSCTWADFDSACDNTRNDAQVSIEAINSTDWRTSCWDGSGWNTLHNNVDLGDDDSEKLEIAGEVFRTVSGEVDLTTDGINFRANGMLYPSGNWGSWTSSVGTSLYDDDTPYDLSVTTSYAEFDMKND